MPRHARLLVPELPHHIVQRAHNRQSCFFVEADYRAYLDWLREYSELYEGRLHSYVLMTNHVHLLVSFADVRLISDMMKRVAQKYAQSLNTRLERTGAWWSGRFWSCPVPDDTYLLACQRYIELNPVRAGLVDTPAAYRWSSYGGNAGLRPDDMLSPHPTYLGLHDEAESRYEAYRNLFALPCVSDEASAIRKATARNCLLGTIK
ncbi:transposase [Pseudoduganella armeniaca]|uniref:Transposase n=1 Tax=Pseudoduganella armeniaca TaxID=2072590 RepID=A0A2R4CER9_9BURK|nr:transposase [Pseudoduganella armeniaca]AVR98123.1 transposase [Pseudoduganella armeniaca]